MKLFEGVNAARDATLTFMVGGTDKAFEACKVLLDVMGFYITSVQHALDVMLRIIRQSKLFQVLIIFFYLIVI